METSWARVICRQHYVRRNVPKKKGVDNNPTNVKCREDEASV
jgi:hypothetical protein